MIGSVPRYEQVLIRIKPEVAQRIRDLAAERDVPAAQIYRAAIDGWLASRFPIPLTSEQLRERQRTASLPECTTPSHVDTTDVTAEFPSTERTVVAPKVRPSKGETVAPRFKGGKR